MRPVNKGASPYDTISSYAEALPYLEKKIGPYCVYCGFRIEHVPEVEHISARAQGGDETAWNNLLLGCKYCNTRKGQKVTPHNKGEYLWPDIDNTAIAYVYPDGVPKINEERLKQLDPSGSFLKKAKNLFNLLVLDNIPKPGSKDRRFNSRVEAFRLATNSLQMWENMPDKEDPAVKAFLNQTIELAKQKGFFSIWMTVFSEEPVILHTLIDAFPGTERTFFDENGRPNTLLCKIEEP